MPTVVDSTVLIDCFRGRPEALAFLVKARRTSNVMSVTPVRTEVLGGIRADEVRRSMSILGLVIWIDVTVELADMAAGLRRRYHRSHSGIDVVDYLLAAAATHVAGALATSNVRHFPMFPGLARPY